MDYQFRDVITTIMTELYAGDVTFVKSTNHMTRVLVDDGPENGMRIFSQNGILLIKALIPKAVRITIYIPDSVNILKLNASTADFSLQNVMLTSVTCVTNGDFSMKGGRVNGLLELRLDDGHVILDDGTIRGMNIQMGCGYVEGRRLLLMGNNMIYTDNGRMKFTLNGYTVNYVVSAGSGVNAEEDVIINSKPLSAYEGSMHNHDAAWLLLAGTLAEPAEFTITKL
ncbi:MAG: DUF4097 family beta strand repeat protein [Ruminococcus sp.]|nr:DUF4097 family beta strand repeat protein [Ruminococcus sp.]